MNRLRKRPAYAGILRLLDVGETEAWIFPPEPPLLHPRRPKATGGGVSETPYSIRAEMSSRLWNQPLRNLPPFGSFSCEFSPIAVIMQRLQELFGLWVLAEFPQAVDKKCSAIAVSWVLYQLKYLGESVLRVMDGKHRRKPPL